MTPKGLRLQVADISGWQFIGEVGCLDTATIHRRIYGSLSLRGCQRRLRLAADHGYLRRAALAVAYREQSHPNGGADLGGAVPVLHMITDKAADVVERETGMRPARVLRSDPAAATFLHRWQVVLHRLAFDDALAAAHLPPAMWIMEQDTWPNAPANLPPNQRRMLYHRFIVNGAPVTCQPDAACLVTTPPHNGTPTRPLLCLWEIDRGPEGLKQILRKLPGYSELVNTCGWSRYFPAIAEMPIRVLWVCRTRERIDNLRRAISGHPIARICRFAVADDITAQAVLTLPVWQTITGERVEFLRSLPADASIPSPLS